MGSTIRQHAQVFAAVLAVILLLYVFGVGTVLHVQLQAPAAGKMQVFWRTGSGGYTEANSAKVMVQQGGNSASLSLANGLLLHSLRIDPVNKPGTVVISGLTLSQFGVVLLRLSPSQGLADLQPLQQIGGEAIGSDGLRFTALGKDPQLELRVRRPLLVARIIGMLAGAALLVQSLLYLLFQMTSLAAAHARGERRSAGSLFSYLFMSAFSVLLFLVISLLAVEYSLRWYYRDVLSTSRVTYFYNRSLHRFMRERNSFGFRGKQFEIAKGPVYRIVVIGDSFAWGQGVLPYTDRFPELIARKLAATYPDLRFEVINMGLAGMNLPQHTQFQQFTLSLHPDYVLYQWYVNDMETSRTGADFKTPTLFGIPLSWHKALLEHSVIYFMLQDLYREIRVAEGKQPTYTQYMTERFMNPKSPSSLAAQQLLDKLAAGFRANGVPFGIVLFPEFSGLKGNPLGFFQQRILSFCGEQRLQCLDLTPDYMPYQDRMRELWVNRFDAHPSKLAHRIAAERILAAYGPVWAAGARQAQGLRQGEAKP